MLVAGLEAYDVVGYGRRTLISEVILGVCSDSSNGLEGFTDCGYHLGETLSTNPVNSLASTGNIEGDVRVRNHEVDDMIGSAFNGNLVSNKALVLVDGISNEKIGVTSCIASKALVEPSDSLGISLRALGKDSLLAADSQEVLGSIKKRPHKPIRKLVKLVLMTVGEDVGLNDIVLTNAMTLVGRFGGRIFNSDNLKGWAALVWKEIIKVPPEIFLLPRGWIEFKFFNEEDVNLVLVGVWRSDNAGILIKRWTPHFVS